MGETKRFPKRRASHQPALEFQTVMSFVLSLLSIRTINHGFGLYMHYSTVQSIVIRGISQKTNSHDTFHSIYPPLDTPHSVA
uniref:Uncharacterized protein n=1 Tax=Anguilla anguilla TaxID=7936 RepID=A0A0E9WE45_ANGAN